MLDPNLIDDEQNHQRCNHLVAISLVSASIALMVLAGIGAWTVAGWIAS